MARKRYKHNGQNKVPSFVMFQTRVLTDPTFVALSARACKALLFLASQYNGSNNGDLTIAWKIAKAKGFKANGNLRLATRELVEAGFVVETRFGGRNRCSLFALAWFPIDECGGKLDVQPSKIAPNDWLWKKKSTNSPQFNAALPVVQSVSEVANGEAH
jgi:hypothetical protein